MDIKNLTPEERAELKAQLEAEERATEAQLQRERQSYNDMRDDFVERMFGELKKLSDEMIAIKQQIFFRIRHAGRNAAAPVQGENGSQKSYNDAQ
ncbi:hypothetical protein NXX78_04510 [Bacteroides fragilis]|nr:hypothetical protein [Bacteroides fragilis]